MTTASVAPKSYKRLGFGALFGGIIGAAAAGPPGAIVGAALGGGVGAVTSPKATFGSGGTVPVNHAKVYREAMTSMREPAELRTLADAFEQEGHRQFATMLRRRATTREMAPEEKKARRDAFRAAMSSDEPAKIIALASAFEGEGSIGAANDLYDHARAVRAALMAGARARPVDDLRMVEQLGDRLGKSVIHYGADSPQAASAAANFLRARGVQPTPEAVRDVLTATRTELMAENLPLPDPAPMPEPPDAAEPEIREMPGTQESIETPPVIEASLEAPVILTSEAAAQVAPPPEAEPPAEPPPEAAETSPAT